MQAHLAFILNGYIDNSNKNKTSAIGRHLAEFLHSGWEAMTRLLGQLIFWLTSQNGENILSLNQLMFPVAESDHKNKASQQPIVYIPNLPSGFLILIRKKFPSAFLGVRNATDL